MKVQSGKRALEDFQRIAAQYPGLFALLTDIAQVESIERLADDAERRLATAQQATIAKQSELDALTKNYAQAVDDINAKLAAKLADGDKLVVAKRAEADKIIADAQGKAKQITDSAQADAAMVAEATAAKLAQVSGAIDEQEKLLAQTSTQVDQTKAQLDDLQQQVAAIEKQKAELLAKLR